MKKKRTYTSVVIKDHTDTIVFRKDFIYPDVGYDYFDFMVYKTSASPIEFIQTDSRGNELPNFRLQLIYDLDNLSNNYTKKREAYIV